MPDTRHLKAKYGFSSWQKAGAGRERLFLRHYRMLGHELAGVNILRARSAMLGPGVRLNQTVWGATRQVTRLKPQDNPILIDSFERSSQALARESLLELLGEFHLPVPLQPVTDDVGDVGFATPDNAFFAFVRGNLVQRLTQQRPTGPLRDVARQIDKDLIKRPSDAVAVRGALTIEPAQDEGQREDNESPRAAPAADKPTPLRRFVLIGIDAMALRRTQRDETPMPEAPAADADEEPPLVKVFCTGGTIEQDVDLVFAQEDEEASIEVFETTAQGVHTCCRYELLDGAWRDAS